MSPIEYLVCLHLITLARAGFPPKTSLLTTSIMEVFGFVDDDVEGGALEKLDEKFRVLFEHSTSETMDLYDPLILAHIADESEGRIQGFLFPKSVSYSCPACEFSPFISGC